MKIEKFNEDLTNDLINAKFLSKKISKIFFKKIDEFDRIVVEYDEHTKAYRFSICFSSIYKETIDAIDKFEDFMGFLKNGWNLQIDNFTYDDLPKAYYDFNLPKIGIDKYLEKINILENSKKYGL